MTRPELARVLAKKAKMTQREAENLIIAFGATIREALEKGDKIVYSNFGTFYTVHYPSKIIMHPKYGAAKKMVMLPTNVAKWMPSENIKEMVAKGLVKDNPTVHGKKRKTESEKQKAENVEDAKPAQHSQPPVLHAPLSTAQGDGIEIPIKKVITKKEEPQEEKEELVDIEKGQSVNIYEDLMHDNKGANKTDSTQKTEEKHGGFWDNIWGDKKPAPEAHPDSLSSEDNKPNEKISLVGEGIFSKSTTAALPKATDKTESAGAKDQKAEHSDEAKLPTFTSDSSNITYIDLSKTTVPKEILGLIPEKIAKKYKAVPVEENGTKLVVAMVDPEDIEAKEIIKRYCGRPLSIRLASETDLSHIIDQYQGLESEVEEAIENTEDKDKSEEDKQKKALLESALDDAPAARVVSSLLKRAIRDKASDIHIEPAEKEVQVRFRLDGILRKKVTLPKEIHLAVISRIKIMANLKIDEQRLPQDGRFSITVDGHKVDFRISTMPTAYGEKAVMRVLDKSAGILTIEQLGLMGSGLETLKANLDKSHGMILVTGPTGSGKTTTLYALIDKLYDEGVNIITLEDPIEYQMPGINQSQVNHEINYTFATGLRSIVRQDPDIIMIGEIRDGETAEMAVQAALTGHVVLSTLHTNDAAGAAPRLTDMKVEPFLLTSSLNLVIGQRLARKICEECKEEYKPTETELKTISTIVEKMPNAEKEKYSKTKLKFYKGKGCKTCADTGYKGRLGIFEVMAVSEPVKQLVLSKTSSTAIAETAVKEGMVTMIQDGVIKAIEGMTTLEEVWRVTKD